MDLNLAQPQPEEYLNLDTPWPGINQDPATTANKTQRFAYGMQPLMDLPTVKSYMDNGDEEGLRQNASATVNIQRSQENADSLRNGTVSDLGSFRKFVTPQSVLEEKFAQQFLGSFHGAPGEDIQDSNGTYSQIANDAPTLAAAAHRVAEQQLAMSDKLYSRIQDATAAVEAEKSKYGFLTSYRENWDQFKDMVGVTNLYTERSLIPGTTWGSGYVINNLEAQRQALNALPYPQNLEAIDKAADYLIQSNPSAAIHFLTYMYQPTIRRNNLDIAFNTLDLAQLGFAGKSAVKGVLYRAELQRMYAEATMRHPEAATGDIQATAMDAAGKSREAGEHRAAVAIQLRGTGNPQDDIEDGIASVFKTRMNDFYKGGPGNAGAEVFNRIMEDNETNRKILMNVSANTSKILRVDPTIFSEEIAKKAYQEMLDAHPWNYDNVANVMPVQADPLPDMVRFYHGHGKESPPSSGGSRFVTTDAKYARDYGSGNNVVSYIDLPKTHPSVEAAEQSYGGYAHFSVPEELNSQFKVLESGTKLDRSLFKYEPHTQTWSADIILKREDGSYFDKAQDVINHLNAKGIPVQNVMGMPIHPGETRLGAHVHEVPTGRVHPGQTKPLDELFAQAAEDKNLSRKQRAELLRMSDIAGGEHVETSTVKWGGQTFTRYKPANGVFGQGKGYYAALRIPLTETSPLMQQAVMETPSAMKSNKGWVNSWGYSKYVRTADEVLNEKIMVNRKLAMYGPALFHKAVAEALEPAYTAFQPIRKLPTDVLSKAEAKARLTAKGPQSSTKTFLGKVQAYFGKNSAFERMLLNTQKMGVDFKSIPELEDYYQRAEGRFPDKVEIAGYFAMKFGTDTDLAFKNIAIGKFMNRLGSERHTLHMTQEIPQGRDASGRFTPKSTQKTQSPEFIGTVQKEFPSHDADARVAIQIGNKFETRLVKNMKYAADQELMEKIKTGEKRMVSLYNASLYPLKDFTGINKMIRYVITDMTETRPLGFFELPTKEAGHFIYPYAQRIKQANIEHDEDIQRYLGDKTIMAVQENALANDVVKGLEEVRKHIQANDIPAAKRAFNMHHMSGTMEWKTVISNFKRQFWDKDQPFYNVPDGQTIADLPHNHFDQYPNFREVAKGGSPDRQFAVDFTGERDAYDTMAMHYQGTHDNPQLAYRPADKVDAFSSLNRSMQRMIKSTYMDDVKITSVHDWLQTYKDKIDLKAMKIKNPDDVFQNPWYYFNNAKLYKGIGGLEKASIEAERYQIKSFVGTPNWWDNLVHSVEQRMADNVYLSETKLGQRAALMGKWAVQGAFRAPDFLRAFAYRAAIGFFAPAQLLVQMTTYASIFGIAGFKAAGKGSFGALAHLISQMPGANDSVLQALDKMAVKLGHFRPGEWLEAKDAFDNSGLGYVGRNTNAMRAYTAPTKFFKSTWGNILDAGEWAFNAGELMTRYGAHYTAYAEHRAIQPTGRLTLNDRNLILNRADLLSGNMTQASRSFLQKGLLSIPTQFLGYYIRTVEQFTGKRLTRGQKLRMFGVYGAMFGLPVATNLTPVPFSEMLNKWANQLGYVPHGQEIDPSVFDTLKQTMLDVAMQGAPEVAIHKLTGNAYNIAGRYGPGPGHGFDFLNTDKTFWSVMTGPVGDMIGQTLASVDPFYMAGWSFIQNKKPPQFTSDNFIQPAKMLSGLNAASKAWIAYNYHTWESKNGNVLINDVSISNAFFMAFSGAQPLDVDRMETFRGITDERENMMKRAETEVKREMRLHFRNLKNDDLANAQVNWNNAYSYANLFSYPLSEMDSLWSEVMKENQATLPDRMLWNRYWKNVPAGQEQQNAEQYEKEIRARNP